MIRVLLVLALVIELVPTVRADDPKPKPDPRPQWQRVMKSAEAKKSAELDGQVAASELADKYPEAIRACEELLELRTRELGADHWAAVHTRWQLEGLRKVAALPADKLTGWRDSRRGMREGMSLARKGQFAPAMTLLRDHEKWCREVVGDDHPLTASNHYNLGTILYVQGKPADAAGYFGRAVSAFRASVGENHLLTARSCHDLAECLNALDKLGEAEPFHRAALAIHRELQGDAHPDTVRHTQFLAANLNAQGNYGEAEPLYRSALEVLRRVRGEKQTDTAAAYNHLARTLNAQGEHAEAEPFYRTALDTRRAVLGEKHRDTAESYNNLAGNLHARGKYTEAGPLYETALRIRREVVGDSHPETAQSYNNLAGNLEARGQYSAATPLFRTALDICREALGESHLYVALGYNNLAGNLQARGQSAEAELLFRTALDRWRQLRGDKHPLTATAYNNLAGNLRSRGKSAEAIPVYRAALEICREALGERHPETAQSYNHLALVLATSGKHAEAAPLFQKALDAWGENHPNVSFGYTNLAGSLQLQGKHVEAAPWFERALDRNRTSRGVNHKDTILSYTNLAANRLALGKRAEAETALTEAARGYEGARVILADRGLDRAAFGMESSPYPKLAAIRAGRRDFSAAWAALETDLARGMLDEAAGRLGIGWTAAERTERDDLRTRSADVDRRLVYLTARTNPTEAEKKELAALEPEWRLLETRVIGLAAGVSRREVAGLAAVQRSLPADAALVAWADVTNPSGGIEEHWGCVIRANGPPAWERLPGGGPDGWTPESEALPQQLRSALAQAAPRDEVEALARKLSAQRLDPLKPHLAGVRRLYVVPVGLMAGVPVETITDEYTIGYTPSGTYLARLKELDRPARPPTLLAVGDPVFRPGGRPAATAADLPPGGLLVTQVVPGGAAANARLRPGDVLLRYAGTDLKSADDLGKAIAAHAADKAVAVTVWREGPKEPAVRQVAPGNLGVILAKEPAPEAVAGRRKTDALIAAAVRGKDWGDLPGTRVEVSRLAKLFGDAATTFTDSAASEQTLDELRSAGRLRGFRYLHLATHGESDDARAFESALILSQDRLPDPAKVKPGEAAADGRLTAGEVLEHWKLDADLVTLSACESGLGRAGGGDGALGFAQAFLLAGSRSVCLSLWKVDDAATALLMDRFYRNLLGKRDGLPGPMPKAEALAEAKKWLRVLTADEAAKWAADLTQGVARADRGKEKALPLLPAVPEAKASDPKAHRPYAHPRYWAAFILIGDPD